MFPSFTLSFQQLNSSDFMFRNFLILWTVSAAIFHVLLGCCSPYVSCCAYACTMCVDSSSSDCSGSKCDEAENHESEQGSNLSSSPCGNSHPDPQKPCDDVDCQFVFAPRTDDTLDTLSSDLLATVQNVYPASFVLDVLPRLTRLERPDQFLTTSEPLYAIKQVWLV